MLRFIARKTVCDAKSTVVLDDAAGQNDEATIR